MLLQFDGPQNCKPVYVQHKIRIKLYLTIFAAISSVWIKFFYSYFATVLVHNVRHGKCSKFLIFSGTQLYSARVFRIIDFIPLTSKNLLYNPKNHYKKLPCRTLCLNFMQFSLFDFSKVFSITFSVVSSRSGRYFKTLPER